MAKLIKTLGEFSELLQEFEHIKTSTGKDELEGLLFTYAVAKNIQNLEVILKVPKEMNSPAKEFVEYTRKRIDLCKIHAVKGPNQEPITIKSEKRVDYAIQDQKAFDKELAVLRKEYKKALSGEEKRIEAFEKFMQTESSIEIYPIGIELVPFGLSVVQMCALMPFLEGDPKQLLEKQKTE